MKLLACSLGAVAMCLSACGKTPTPTGQSTKTAQQDSHGSQNRGRGVLTREEVTAILGAPVTSMEGAATDMEYKTDTLSLQTSVGIEVQEDSDQAMAGVQAVGGFSDNSQVRFELQQSAQTFPQNRVVLHQHESTLRVRTVQADPLRTARAACSAVQS